MAHINFVIPATKAELLSESNDYYVKEVIPVKDLTTQLRNARISLKEEGVEFIIDYFNVFYSVLHHGDVAPLDVIYKSYEDLHRAIIELNKTLGFLLEDKDNLSDEVKMKQLNIIKMLIYIYTQIIILIEQKNETRNQGLFKGRKKASNDQGSFNIDRKSVLLTLNYIIQREISLFWDPPVIEESFISAVSDVCYRFLENADIKGEKEVRAEIFNLLGYLIKTYNHGMSFIIRMVQLIKIHEHLIHCVPEGIQQLVQNCNCKGVVHDFLREITEWQTDEKFQDGQGVRYCSTVLSSMASLMPDLMIPELLYLTKYLGHDAAPLRNSVLNVITEVIINVLTKHELTDEQRESRDDFLHILMDHMDDISAHVRSKVVQQWARLQKENAIPIKFINQVLEKVIDHLDDKGALVRKSAANCVTTFLSHNAFSANLSLSKMQEELQHKENMLKTIKSQFETVLACKLEEIEAEWNSKVDGIRKAIEDLQEAENEESLTEEENELPNDQLCEIIRLYLSEGKYKEAFKLCKAAGEEIDEFEEFRKNNEPHSTDLYLVTLHSIFVNAQKLIEDIKSGQIRTNLNMTEDDLKKLQALEAAVDFLNDSVTFLKLIDSAIYPMSELLETTAIGDMQEAVAFFIAAYQFNIDNASSGILAMLRIMQRNEQERKDIIVEAFKTIYLKTDSQNLNEHTTTIVNRLIASLKSVPINNVDDLQLIISEWVAKGTLDNGVINTLWTYFTKKSPVSDDDSHAATELLRMAAVGRRTIITRNIKLVASVAFAERGEENMPFLGSACELLAVAGKERIDMTADNPPFKIKPEDQIFKDLIGILCKKFFEPVDYYNKALSGAIDFIYKLCSKPDKLCEEMIQIIMDKLVKDMEVSEDNDLDKFVIMRLCQMLGIVAVKHLEFLDETVYKELKRRNNIREKRKEATKGNKNKKRASKSASASARALAHENSLNTSLTEESDLEGAQGEDTDAEFILNVLENDTVSGSGGLGKLSYIVKGICERPDLYDDVMIQGTAVIALIRFMLVSSKFCGQNIQLLFTIFEKTIYPEIKCSILVHLSDLLTRFPNIVEPWTPKIYERLNDPLESIRKATFFTLSNLILRDMIRAHSHISQMACCLVDKDEELRGMCRTFFVSLSHKENNLYSVLPDIFTHLMDLKDISEDDLKSIMKFLFDLMDKTKHNENLVDRFCCKFRLTDDVNQHRHISYCLSLITYNEKALRKLQENFPTYRYLVRDPEVYGNFKTILQNSNKHQVGKADLKPIIAEIEKSINSVFEMDEDGNLMKPPPIPKQTRKGKGRTVKKNKISKRKTENSDSEEDFDASNIEEVTQKRSSRRSKPQKRHIEDSDSD